MIDERKIMSNPFVVKFVLKGELEKYGTVTESTQRYLLSHGLITSPITASEAVDLLLKIA